MRPAIPVQTVFGNHIRQLRERAGLTIEQLSEKSGFSSHRLRAIERGEINLNLGTMLILAMSMDTTLQDFLGGVAPKLDHRKFCAARIIPFSRYPGSQQNHCRKFRSTDHTRGLPLSSISDLGSKASRAQDLVSLASTKSRPANRFSSEEFELNA